MTLPVAKRRLQMERVVQWLRKKFPKSKKEVVSLGLDLSFTATGVVVLSSTRGLLYHGSITTAATDGSDIERMHRIKQEFSEMLREYDPDIIGMEAITVWNNPAATHKLIYVESMLYAAMQEHWRRAPLIRLITSQIKKVATGDSKSHKSQVLKGVLLNYGANLDTDDQADAYCAAIAAMTLPDLIDHYYEWEPKFEDHKIFLRDFDNKKVEPFCIQGLYETLVGMVSASSGEILKTNDKAAWYRTRNELNAEDEGE